MKKIILQSPKGRTEPEYKEQEKRFWKVSKDYLNWKPCIVCGGELTQKRKAFFQCINCDLGYIADERDMKK